MVRGCLDRQRVRVQAPGLRGPTTSGRKSCERASAQVVGSQVSARAARGARVELSCCMGRWVH
jgi:hypothetical protein